MLKYYNREGIETRNKNEAAAYSDIHEKFSENPVYWVKFDRNSNDFFKPMEELNRPTDYYFKSVNETCFKHYINFLKHADNSCYFKARSELANEN